MTATAAHDYTHTGTDNHRPTRENRVSRQSPCEWCGDTKYCLRFDDGGSFCRTVGDAHQWTDAFMGGYLHRADGTEITPRPIRPVAPAVEVANSDVQHAIYTDLLRLCALSDAHHALLTSPAHGLDDQQASLYGTLPTDPTARRAIVDALVTRHGTATLLRVPGFILNESSRIALAPLAGVLMPRRDLQGRLTGFMVRSDKPDVAPRYLWLSSASAGGPSSGTAPHVATPVGGVRNPHEVYIVEGIKKGDLLAERMGCMVISINGVGTWRAAEEVLDELAARGVDTCVIALDRDIKPKAVEHVERSRQRLAAAAVARGYATRIASWDKDVAKGPDDLLIAGHTFIIERYLPLPRVGDDNTAPLAGVAPATDGSGMVTIDPGLLALLIEKSMATETLRRKYQQQNLLITDKRLKPGDKVLAAAVWDMAMPEGRDPGPPAPRKIYRAALAERTGMSVSTISRKLQDASKMGLITYESRQTGPDNTELWVGVGRLPDKALTAAQVNDLAQNRQKDRDRKRCPNCGGTHLQATMYVCADCHQTCTDDEATAAGHETITMDSGAVVDVETGEIITAAPTRAESAQGQMTRHNDGPDAIDTPPLKSAHLSTLETGCADSVRGPAPTPATLSMDLDLTPVSPAPVDALTDKPTERCQACRTVNYRWSERWREWQCATCFPAAVKNATGLLNIAGGSSIGQEARHGR